MEKKIVGLNTYFKSLEILMSMSFLREFHYWIMMRLLSMQSI